MRLAILFPGAFLLASRLVTAAEVALSNGLVAYLPLQEDLRDHSAKPHPVEVSGIVELKDGAAWFPGKEDWLEMPFIALNDRAYAISVWVKPVGDSPSYGLLTQYDRSESGHHFHLMIRDGLRPWLGHYENDLVSPVSLSNSGAWQHLVFQYTNRRQQIWINGRLICERVAEAYHGVAGATCLGKNPNWRNVPARSFAGWMSDFRLYDRALTFEEIATLISTPPQPVEKLSPSPTPQPAGSVAPAGASAVPLFSIDAKAMVLRGMAGEEYALEVSEDLVKWETLDSVTVAADGEVRFVDPDARDFPQRFYRIRYRRQ